MTKVAQAWRLAVVLLCMQVGLTAHAGRIERERTETFRIILKDGTTREAARYPLVAFGGVRATLTDGRFIVLDVAKVDLDLSRSAWNTASEWAALDHAKLQGKAFPSFVAADAKGAAVPIRPSSSGLTIVEVWSAY
jgi:hypothetical protein